jgi:hypothetical protein
VEASWRKPEDDPLIQASDLNSEPTLMLSLQVRRDEAIGDFIAGV